MIRDIVEAQIDQDDVNQSGWDAVNDIASFLLSHATIIDNATLEWAVVDGTWGGKHLRLIISDDVDITL